MTGTNPPPPNQLIDLRNTWAGTREETDPNYGGGTVDLAVVVYGPDGKMYSSPGAARDAGVTNWTMTPPDPNSGGTIMPVPQPGQPQWSNTLTAPQYTYGSDSYIPPVADVGTVANVNTGSTGNTGGMTEFVQTAIDLKNNPSDQGLKDLFMSYLPGVLGLPQDFKNQNRSESNGRDRDNTGNAGVSSAPPSGGYTGLRDMFDGGGPGVKGGPFQGGGVLSNIANKIFGRAEGGQVRNYAHGGQVRGFANGGTEGVVIEDLARSAIDRAEAAEDTLPPVDPNAALEAMLNRYAPQTVTSEQIAAASERRLAEQKAFEDILRSQLQSTDSNPMSKAEKYFRLAAAFGAPTKTGHFSENLALAGQTLAEDLAAKAQREREARERGLGVELEIQKMRMGTAGEEYDALRGVQSEEAKYRRDVANELIKEQIASGKAGYTQVTGAELGLTGEDAGKMFNVSPEGQVTAIGGAGTTVTNVIGGEGTTGAMNKKLAEAEGALLATYLQQGPIASGALQDLSLLQEILPMAPQNPLAGRFAEMFPGVSSAGAAASSVIKRVAPTLRVEGSGSSSDIEYNGMLQSLPALQNYPEANAAIVAMMQAKAAINLERSELVRAYLNSKQTDKEAATLRAQLSELDKRSIMTPELRNTIAMLNEGSGGGSTIRTWNPETQELE